MANDDELIFKGKALRDLRGIKDVLETQGDPFLANILNRAIDCIENQPAQKPIDAMLTLAAKYEAALKDLVEIADCDYCMHGHKNNAQSEIPTCLADCEECGETCACYRCEDGSEWAWRGSSV